MRIRIFATLALCLFLVVAPGCQALNAAATLNPKLDKTVAQMNDLDGKVASVLDQGKAIFDQGKDIVGDVKDLHSEARAQADADGDGKLSLTEMLTYAALVLGGGAGIAAKAGSSKESRKRKEIHERIDKLKV